VIGANPTVSQSANSSIIHSSYFLAALQGVRRQCRLNRKPCYVEAGLNSGQGGQTASFKVLYASHCLVGWCLQWTKNQPTAK